MKDKSKTWVVAIIVVAALLLVYWIFDSPEVTSVINEQSKDTINGLTLE